MWTDRESGRVVLTEVQWWHPPESSVQPEWAGSEYDRGALTNLSARSTASPADPALRPNPPPSALPVTLRANPSPRDHATLSVFSSGFCSDKLLHSASDRWHRRSRSRTRPRISRQLFWRRRIYEFSFFSIENIRARFVASLELYYWGRMSEVGAV